MEFLVYYLLLFVNIIEAVRGPSHCPPVQINHGSAKYKQRGRFVKFLCNNGYTLAGERYSTCLHGQWDAKLPKCVRNNCRPPKTPLNGLIFPTHNGAVLNFFCKPDYQLRGPMIIHCDGAKWDNLPPSCQKTHTTVQFRCDFESDDLCGWTHDLNHDFDWTRLNYQTPSHAIGTGPSYDHTKGVKNDGYYMYIESTSRNVNDTARLISPIYQKSFTTSTVQCFEFFYHMYGKTTGVLNVYLKKFNVDWRNSSKLWTKSGNQGDQWYRGFINLGPIDDDYQIIIEGIRGPGYVSDIAIDDVRIIPNCTDDDIDQDFTTEFPATSIDPFVVESCENRCDQNATTPAPPENQTNSILLCDCDDDCIVRGRCCPDYFDYCLIGVSTTTDFTETETTLSPTTTTTTTTTPTTTTVKTTTTSITPSTRTTVKRTTPTSTTVRTTTRPTTTTTKTTTTTAMLKYLGPGGDNTDLKNDEIDLIPPISDTNDDSNDVPIVPQITHERITNNNDNHQQSPPTTTPPPPHHKTVIFVIGVIIGILSTSVIIMFLIKKYELFNCKRFNMRQSPNGDSQSDVRFLTSDEILDLNLPGDYDTL